VATADGRVGDLAVVWSPQGSSSMIATPCRPAPRRMTGTDAAPIRVIAWRRWGLVGASLVAVPAGYTVWLVVTDAPAYQFLVRLYVDRVPLKQTLRQWGILAPVVFIALQALQVIIAPIPGGSPASSGAISSANGWGSSIPPSAWAAGSALTTFAPWSA